MTAITSELILRLNDGVTGPARLIDAALRRLERTIASTIGNKTGMGFAAASVAMRKEAAAITRSASDMGHATHALGTALAGLGIGHGLKEMIDQGAALNKELIALKNAGNPVGDIAKGMAEANRLITAIPTSTLTDNVRLLNETTGAFGSFQHALENLEFNSKLASNLQSTIGDKVGSTGKMFNQLVRAFEIRGTAFDPKKYQQEASELAKAFTFTRGNVNPEQFLTFAQNSNPAIKGFSTEFLTQLAPSLIQTFGGDKAGTGITAFEKIVKGGLTDKSQAKEWERIGLITSQQLQDNRGQSPGWKSGQLKGTDMALSNPLDFMENVVLPAIKRTGVDIMDPVALGKELDTLFKNKRAQGMAYELGQAITRAALRKDQRLIARVPGVDEQFKANLEDLGTSLKALKASFENVFAAVSGPWIKPMAAGVMDLSISMQHLAQFLQTNPFAGGTLGLLTGLTGAAALVKVFRASLATLGVTGLRPVALIRGAMLGLRAAALTAVTGVGGAFLALLNPLAIVRGAIVGVGAVIRGLVYASGIGALTAAGYYLYENWSNVGVAIEAFGGAFMRALGPAAKTLQPIIDDVTELWGEVQSALGPTDDMGDNWARIGLELGKVVGTDLAPWVGSIRAAWDQVKSLGSVWTILTSADPIGAAVTAMRPKMNALAAEGWQAFVSYDWAGLGTAVVNRIGEALRGISSAFVALAREGWDAFMAYDWPGLGMRIVQAIISGIEGMASGLGSAIGGAIQRALPGWMGGVPGGGTPRLGVGPGRGAGPGRSPTGAPVTAPLSFKPPSGPIPGMSPAELDIYARTVLGEAGGEGETGMAAVAQVIQNRVKAGAFGSGYGGVALAPHQFSVWNPGDPAGGVARGADPGSASYKRAVEIIGGVVSGAIPDMTGGATHYHTGAVHPRWDESMYKHPTKVIGHHIFGNPDSRFPGTGDARARGGSVASGRSYLIGERGMEMFTAGASGAITSNERLQAALGGAGGAKGQPNIHFAPHMPITIHGGGNLSADEVGETVASAMKRELVAVLESSFSDKD